MSYFARFNPTELVPARELLGGLRQSVQGTGGIQNGTVGAVQQSAFNQLLMAQIRAQSRNPMLKQAPAATPRGARGRGTGRRARACSTRSPPGAPARRPFRPRHPDPPTRSSKVGPSSIVVGRPAKGFIGNPRPSTVAAHPPTTRIRPPRQIATDGRLPNIPVFGRFKP